jgi:5-methylthioadenosine/S-adenosylhomocysteine deaminase
MYMHMDHVAQAVVESGIRANLSRSPLRFIAREKGGTVHDIDSCLDFYKRWNNSANGRIKVYIEVHSVYLFDEEAMEAAAKLAKQLGTGINMHLEETVGEREISLEKYGMNSTEICLKSGVFDVPVVAAHCVHLTDNDVGILKQKSVNVVHNPTSNLKLGSGIARIPYLLNEGINISLGTDGAASNNNLDMFEEMHLAALIHKGAEKNPILVDAQSALRMATVNGANAIGFGRETGCIREGMKADLIILDTDKIHFTPMNNPMSAVVYSAQGSDVDTVIVDGIILMENRELKTIDEEKVKYMAKEISKKL